jgi:putative transposase
MTGFISIDRSLVVRDGQATYAFNRFLNDRALIQLENQTTGEYRSVPVNVFQRKIERREFVVVCGESNATHPLQDRIVDTTQLPQDVKERVELKQALIAHLRKLGITRGARRRVAAETATFIRRLNKKRQLANKPPVNLPSDSTVMGWWRNYEGSGRNVAAFLRKPNARKEHQANSDELVDWALDKFYLTKSRFTLKYAYERLVDRSREEAAEKGEEPVVISYQTFSRRMRELDAYMVAERRYGPAYARHNFRASYNGTRADRALERVEIDHTLLNWVVVCDRTGLPLGRPTLTVVIDSYSGYITGLYVSFNGPGIVSVLKAIKSAIKGKDDVVTEAGCKQPWIAWGMPDAVIVDNGLEFHCEVFRHVQLQLSIDVEYCAVRQPWMKPHVERCLGDLDVIPVAEGRVYKGEANVLPTDPKECAAIPLSKLSRGLTIWACDMHGFQFNNQRLAKPYELFRDSLLRSPPPQMPTSLAGLDLIAAMQKNLTVGHGGIVMHGLSYAGPHLSDLIKAAGGKHKTAAKWDPDNMGLLYALHCRTNEWVPLWCTRQDVALDLTWNQLRVIRKALRKDGLKDSVDNMAKTRQRLREAWLEPFARKNVKLEASHVNRFAQVSASAAPPDEAVVNPQVLYVPDAPSYTEQDIPQFDTGAIY